MFNSTLITSILLGISLMVINLFSNHFHAKGYIGWLGICINKKHKAIYLIVNIIVQQEFELRKHGDFYTTLKVLYRNLLMQYVNFLHYLQETMT